MGGPDIQEQKTPPPINAIAESNFDKLKKTYPDQKDKVDFLNNDTFKDIKEPLAATIHSLAKEHIVSSEEFWNNIQQVVEKIFSDPLYEIDPQQKGIDARNIFLFRTEFEKTKEQEIKTENKDIKKEEEKNIDNKSKNIDNKSKIIETGFKNLEIKYT
ncbi:MAG: hypothetical protein WCP92_06215 [bacterium]